MRLYQLFIALMVLFISSGCSTKSTSPSICKTTCDDLMVYYQFKGDATDQSGNDFNGKVINASLVKNRFGQQNHAFSFNGQDSMIQIIETQKLVNILKNRYSLSVWFKVEKKTNNDKMDLLVIKGNKGYFGLKILSPDKFTASINHLVKSNRMNKWALLKYDSIKLGKYHHIVGTVDVQKEKIAIYLDGEKYKEVSGIHNKADIISNAKWGIGRITIDNNEYPFSGTIDEVRIYNRALSENEVKELFQSTKIP
jgi:hypothetical protein